MGADAHKVNYSIFNIGPGLVGQCAFWADTAVFFWSDWPIEQVDQPVVFFLN